MAWAARRTCSSSAPPTGPTLLILPSWGEILLWIQMCSWWFSRSSVPWLSKDVLGSEEILWSLIFLKDCRFCYFLHNKDIIMKLKLILIKLIVNFSKAWPSWPADLHPSAGRWFKDGNSQVCLISFYLNETFFAAAISKLFLGALFTVVFPGLTCASPQWLTLLTSHTWQR